jgi:hypothetical protein
MRLTTTTNVSVDGVMQGLGAPDEDRRGGVDRGGWAIPLLNTEAMDHLNKVSAAATAFLFGRRTDEIFARSWGTGSWGTHQGDNPISVALNTKTTCRGITIQTDRPAGRPQDAPSTTDPNP